MTYEIVPEYNWVEDIINQQGPPGSLHRRISYFRVSRKSLQLMVHCWFGARWFGFLGFPKMKGREKKGFESQPTGPQTTNHCSSLSELPDIQSCAGARQVKSWIMKFIETPYIYNIHVYIYISWG